MLTIWDHLMVWGGFFLFGFSVGIFMMRGIMEGSKWRRY